MPTFHRSGSSGSVAEHLVFVRGTSDEVSEVVCWTRAGDPSVSTWV